jgi:pyruvate/2-oxoglutarate dehydrogenase complex dihydrolipoamide acyltransferase (E2) component
MPIVDVLVPQMGEGLQEVLVVEFFKQPGEKIRRDELFYSMETDKATMEVESPHEGTLIEWLAGVGDTLDIGAPICRMQVEDGPAVPLTPVMGNIEVDLRAIPPRTRAYAKEKGIDDTVLVTIPAASGKLMPEDIDAFLAKPASTPKTSDDWTERPLLAQDKTFIFRLKRSAEQVIPATAKRQIAWEPVRAYAEKKKAELPDSPPSSFNCVAYAIAKATVEHPKFRSTLLREEAIREHKHVNLGIAVAVPTGELTVAVVPAANSLSFEAFVSASKTNIALARGGTDQTTENTQLLLTYMGPYEIIDAVPVLVAPAAAVLFIGSPFEQSNKLVVNLVLTFDHRLVHGVEAAEFLKTVAQNIESLG